MKVMLPIDYHADHNLCTDSNVCPHPYMHVWDGERICKDCWYHLNMKSPNGDGSFLPAGATEEERLRNAERIQIEEEFERAIPGDTIPDGLVGEEAKKHIGKISASRAVSIEFLLQFTEFYDCYDWTSWDVIRKIIQPLTAKHGRCRFVELPFMKEKGYVGQANTFLSYAQAGKWGDCIAAVADGGASRSRYVWIDVFAVRQWACAIPDLDFGSTILNCTSFIVVVSHQEEVENMENMDIVSGRSESLSAGVRKQIAFMRVWCLVEACQAAQMENMPYILKCGRYVKKEDGSLAFESNGGMLEKLSYLVNIEKAEATVESDRLRIIGEVRDTVGIDRLNSIIRDQCR